MPGRFLQPDHSQGDANTIGGYMAVHDRPAAFEGRDGLSYSVEIETDTTGDPARPYGAFLLFLRWRRVGAQSVEGHLETEFLGYGDTPADARAVVGRLLLRDVKVMLDALIEKHTGSAPQRRWWDAMRDEGGST